jgi:hypothetical protein
MHPNKNQFDSQSMGKALGWSRTSGSEHPYPEGNHAVKYRAGSSDDIVDEVLNLGGGHVKVKKKGK